MKKLVLLFVVMVFCLPLYSTFEEKERFNFNAYYIKSVSEKYVTLDIQDSRYNSGIIMITYQGLLDKETVFHWEISGNIVTRVNLYFKFTPLQAYKDGMYFIPKHTFQLKSSGNTLIVPESINGAALSDTFLVKEKNKVSFNKAQGNYPFPIEHFTGTGNPPSDYYYQILLYGNIQKQVGNSKIALTQDEEVFWKRSGYCELTIEDYYTDTQYTGDFNYISNVKIEVTVP